MRIIDKIVKQIDFDYNRQEGVSINTETDLPFTKINL